MEYYYKSKERKLDLVGEQTEEAIQKSINEITGKIRFLRLQNMASNKTKIQQLEESLAAEWVKLRQVRNKQSNHNSRT